MSGPAQLPVLPPGWVSTGTGYLDCSPEGMADKLKQIADLRARLYGGVQAVGDRGRSVTYRDQTDLVRAIKGLEAEVAYCTTGAWPRGPARLYTVPQVKGL
jgi:hypothetical protein